MSSVQFLTQTTINGDTHSEGIFSESLLCVESKGVGKEPEPTELACAEVSFLEHLGIAAGKIKLGDLCLSMALGSPPLSACLRGLSSVCHLQSLPSQAVLRSKVSFP